MASFNRVILLGNVTRDIDLKHTQSGTAVAQIGLAVNDKRKNAQGEWIEETTFVDITAWGRTAEIASEYLSKGSQVLFEGRLKLDQWEKDGQKHSKLHIVAESMQLLGNKNDGPRRTNTESQEPRRQQNSNRPQPQQQPQQYDESIPF